MIAALFFNQFANQWKANWQFKPASSSLSGGQFRRDSSGRVLV